MEWWQIVLILLAAIVIGGIVGTLLSYLILRFVKKRETTFLSDLASRFPKMPKAAPVVKAEAKFTAPDLLAEVTHNRKLAVEPADDKLSTFQTDIWDAHRYQVDALPANLRDDLEQVYTDIRLANSLAWLSTEFSRRTPSLDENYTRLRTSIAEKLDKIKVLLEQMGKD